MSNPKIKFVVTPPPDADVENSDASYTDTVASGGLLVLPDSQINVNSVDSGDVVSVKTIDVNITDGVDPVTPTSVGLVGNTLTIEVPSGGATMNVDFSADKVVANIGETIAFTDLTDNSPTHWSWRFDNAGVSISQNPNFIFNTKGFKNITLLAGKVGVGSVEIKNNYLEILFQGILDIYTTADLAFSLRRLRVGYTGNCIRVRRSGDNTEQDIGFNATDTLDTAALLAFVGSGNGFVTAWYDQSGNSRNIAQSTAVNQPQIVSSGVVLTRNGLPCVRYSASINTMALVTASNYSVPAATTFSAVFTPLAGTSSYRYIYTVGTTASAVAFHAFGYRAGGTQDDWILEDALYFGNGFGSGRNPRLISNGQRFFNGGQYVTFGTMNGTANILDVNNSVSTTRVNNAAAIPTQSGIFRLGNSSANNEQLSGDVQEFILWGNNLTSDKAGIISNANNFYNVF
jgi:PKD repeat protein